MINKQSAVFDQSHVANQHSRISWTAIFVGTLVGMGLSFLVNLFSMAVGLSLMTTSKEGLVSLAFGGFIGFAIGIYASMFFTGFTAGYLGRPYCRHRYLGVIYGFVTWSLTLIFSILIASNLTHYMSYYAKYVANPKTFVMTPTDKQLIKIEEASPQVNQTEHAVALQPKQINFVGMQALVIFVLFLLGAIASCVGGYFGVGPRNE